VLTVPLPTPFLNGQILNVLFLVRHLPAQNVRSVIESLEAWLKARTKPSRDKLVVGTALDLMTRSKGELVATARRSITLRARGRASRNLQPSPNVF
jgi:hypothetical protein